MKLSLFPSMLALPTRSLHVGRDAESFSVSGEPRVDLRSLGPIRCVFRLLVEAHCASPGRPLTVDEIFDAAWCGAKAECSTLGGRRGRVYTVLSKLRRMGLAAVLRRTDVGYHLDPRCCVIVEGAIVARPAPHTTVVWDDFPARLAS